MEVRSLGAGCLREHWCFGVYGLSQRLRASGSGAIILLLRKGKVMQLTCEHCRRRVELLANDKCLYCWDELAIHFVSMIRTERSRSGQRPLSLGIGKHNLYLGGRVSDNGVL